MATTKKLRKFPKAGTIGNMVLTALAKNPDLKTEDILPAIKAKFSDSKFNPAHLAWYKHQVKNGNYILVKDAEKTPAKDTTKVSKDGDPSSKRSLDPLSPKKKGRGRSRKSRKGVKQNA